MLRIKTTFTFALLGAVLSMTALTAPAPAATKPGPKEIGVYTDWTAYSWKDKDGKVCYMLAQPTDSRPKNVNRGDIYLMITYRKGGGNGVVSHNTGYPYMENSEARVSIGRQEFKLFTHEDTAWAPNEKTDTALVKAMRAGAKLVVKGTSHRGTDTTDSYSLAGFSAAHRAIKAACK